MVWNSSRQEWRALLRLLETVGLFPVGKVEHSLVKEVFQVLVSTDQRACHVLMEWSPVGLVGRACPTRQLL